METTISPQSAGGKATAIKLRKEALRKYYENPNVCQYCGEVIKVRSKEKIQAVKRRKFCNGSCFAKYSNPQRKRRNPNLPKHLTELCENCETPISWGATMCNTCRHNQMSTVHTKTKGELVKRAKYWVQYRAAITRHARKVYKKSGKGYECFICGYNTHVDICHLKDVASFSDDTTVAVINAPDNLEALCKNHHWEFDNGVLEVQGIKRNKK